MRRAPVLQHCEVLFVEVSALNEGDASVVVITGASSGIGRSTAALFARQGWRVGLIARGTEGLAAARIDIEATGTLAACVHADVTDSAKLSEAGNAIVVALGPLDVWINCPATVSMVTSMTCLRSNSGA